MDVIIKCLLNNNLIDDNMISVIDQNWMYKCDKYTRYVKSPRYMSRWFRLLKEEDEKIERMKKEDEKYGIRVDYVNKYKVYMPDIRLCFDLNA